MMPAKLGFLLRFFTFCLSTAPVLSGVARLSESMCRDLKDPCGLEQDPGSCYEIHFRFFYNRSSKLCESFIYSGCNGNLNNFQLKIECDIQCNENYRTVRLAGNKRDTKKANHETIESAKKTPQAALQAQQAPPCQPWHLDSCKEKLNLSLNLNLSLRIGAFVDVLGCTI
ncbi:kunitz-type protease inhibitor 4-like [Psammomys obesus]|uniref:kunitz-type protease inhibitor 4-like n=1 Tax=Psammomys obesus TaxID=48139 RepID=UPI002452E33E|nr:kunitz-type protease inhibitor 4-like [Psammomys obesus]